VLVCSAASTFLSDRAVEMFVGSFLRHSWTHKAVAAGSTGSRVHVYRWVWKGDDKLPTITDDFFKQVRGLGRVCTHMPTCAKAKHYQATGIQSQPCAARIAHRKATALTRMSMGVGLHQVKPGLSSLSNDAKGAAASLQPLLDYALTVMPPHAGLSGHVRLRQAAPLQKMSQPLAFRACVLCAFA